MTRTPVTSTSIASAGYDPARLILEIEFTSGKTYQYFDVPAAVFEALMASKSKGRFVNEEIKPRFDFSEV